LYFLTHNKLRDSLLLLRLRDFDALLTLQYQLLTLLYQLGCSNYTRVVTLNLFILFWLKSVNHPAFFTLKNCPEAFSEEKGETSLAFLASLKLASSNNLSVLRQHYQLQPYCKQVSKFYSNNCKTKQPSFRKPLSPSNLKVRNLSAHLKKVWRALQHSTFQHYPSSSTRQTSYPPLAQQSFVLQPCPNPLLRSLSLQHINKLLKSIQKGFWTENWWGQSVLCLLPKDHLTYKLLPSPTSLPLPTLSQTVDSTISSSSQPTSFTLSETTPLPSNFTDNLFITLQSEFDFFGSNNIFNFYS